MCMREKKRGFGWRGTSVVGDVKGMNAEWGNEMDWVDGSVHY